MRLVGTTLHEGHGTGRLLILDEGLSLWGGTDVATGRIVEARHPQHSDRITGRVVAFPSVRGSSSSATVLAEQLRRRVGPCAILVREPDAILVLGALVAAELYAHRMPIVLLDPADFDLLAGEGAATVTGGPEEAIVDIE
jgi:predicted aconitase with swiveling domain